MRKRARVAAVACGLAMVGLVATPATASSAREAEPRVNCFANSDANHRVWQAHRSDDNGYANWHEHGDYLTVNDKDGGASTVAWLFVCIDSRWRLKGEYLDSGGDWETYDFDFKERRRVYIIACQYVSPGRGDDCGDAEFGNA